MIHALEICGIAQPFGSQLVAAMQADIGERPHRSVLLAHDQHGFLADLRADIVARLLDIIGSAAEQPDLCPDPIPFQLHERFAGVALSRNNIVAEIGILLLLDGSALRPVLGVHPDDIDYTLDVHC